MNFDEVEKLINQDRKRKIGQDHTRTEVDLDTGEMNRIIESHTLSVNVEPDYIKLYTGFQLLFNDLDTSLTPYIVAFGRYMTYANHREKKYRLSIQTTQFVREEVAEAIGVSDSMVKKIIKKLVDAGIFIPYQNKDGKRARGIYFVNPWVMAKGEWKDIKQLRSQFEFVTGASSTVLVDEEGIQKVVVPLTYKTKEDGQMQLNFDAEI